MKDSKHGTGLRAVIRRRPILWVSATAIVALGVGGAVTSSDSVSRSDYDKVETRLASSTAEVRDLRSEREASSRQVRTAREQVDSAKAVAARVTARGKVPSFEHQTVEEVRGSGTVGDFDWRVSTTRQVADAEPGTVIWQSPAAGAKLGREGSIHLRVAKRAPPKPRQWVSVASLSGTGAKRTGEFQIPSDEKVRVKYTYGGDQNDTLQLKQPDEGDDSFGDLIVNEIGSYSGTSRLYGKAGSYYLDVDGGSWSIDVQVFKRP